MKSGDATPDPGIRGTSGDAGDVTSDHTADDAHEVMRHKIGELIRSSGQDCYASVSELLGRSHSYIQQYLTRHSPKVLRESDRRRIARYFNIPEWELLLPEEMPGDVTDSADLVMIPHWRAAPNGRDGERQNSDGGTTAGPEDTYHPFLKTWLAARFTAPATALAMIGIQGDVMAPTLCDGDQVLVDTQHVRFRNDGLYMIRAGDVVRPRRLTAHPASDLVIISNDNPLYPGALECNPDDVMVVGRVLWVGRSL